VKKSRTEWDDITMSGQLVIEEAALVGLHDRPSLVAL
jgi:hypothetical protein